MVKKFILFIFILVLAKTGVIMPRSEVLASARVDNGQPTVAGGGTHFFAIQSDGSLWSWSSVNNWDRANTWGILGDGTTYDRREPMKILENVIAVYTRNNVAMAIKKDNTLWAWGRNINGMLGTGTTENKYYPIQIMENVVAASIGIRHAMALKADGSLWTWGINDRGQLGDGTTDNHFYPTKIMDNVIAISAGQLHSFALKNDNTLWSWGGNFNGQLGNGTTIDNHYPAQVMENIAAIFTFGAAAYAIDLYNDLWAWGNGAIGDGTRLLNRLSPVKILSDVVAVSASGSWNYAMAITSDGNLWAWGETAVRNGSRNGLLGLGINSNTHGASVFLYPTHIMSGVAAIVAGFGHGMAIKYDNSLWIWGCNSGQQIRNIENGFLQREIPPFQMMENVMLPQRITPLLNYEDVLEYE